MGGAPQGAMRVASQIWQVVFASQTLQVFCLAFRKKAQYVVVSILCVSLRRLHPNGTFSQDSQGGVPKLSCVRLLGLWELISPNSDLRLEWGLNQSCSSPRELFNALLHSFCKRREEVDSWLLVVGSQIASLTPGPSFAHNLGCRCPNGSCEAILDIYTSRPFQRYKKNPNARCFDPCNQALSFWESQRIPSSHFWECEFHPHTQPKVGLRQLWYLEKHSRNTTSFWIMIVDLRFFLHVIQSNPKFIYLHMIDITCVAFMHRFHKQKL